MVVVPARGRAQAEKASHLKLATHEMGKWWCQAEELLGWSRGETLQEVVEMRSSNVGHHIVSSNESFWVRTWKYIYIYYSSRKRRHGKLDITGHVWIHAGKMIDERFLAMSGLWLAGSICASCYISRFTKFLLDGLAKPRVTDNWWVQWTNWISIPYVSRKKCGWIQTSLVSYSQIPCLGSRSNSWHSFLFRKYWWYISWDFRSLI